MKQIFFFVCVLAIAYCAPERCCLPKQFLADHSVFQEVGSDRGTAFLEYTVDSLSNNLRIDLYANWSGVIYYFTIWDLYSSSQRCVLNIVNQFCVCNGFEATFPSLCIPDDFVFQDNIYIGSQLCSTWYEYDPANNTKASITVTNDGKCIPITDSVEDPIIGFQVGLYFNVTAGPVDQNLFTPCTPPGEATFDSDMQVVEEILQNTYKRSFFMRT